jgi:hypothetical protein
VDHLGVSVQKRLFDCRGRAEMWLAMKERRNEREKARFLSARYLGVSGFGGKKSVPEDTALTGLAEAAPWERGAYGAEGMESLR